MVDELLVTVTLPFEIASVVGSPHTESAIPTASSTIDAVRLLCFTRMPPSTSCAFPLRSVQKRPGSGLVADLGSLDTVAPNLSQILRMGFAHRSPSLVDKMLVTYFAI